MSPGARRKWWLYAGLIFLTGLLSGAVVGWSTARRRGPMPPSGRMFSSQFREALQGEFNLSAEQMRQIDPILERRAKGIDEVFSRSRNDVETLIKTSNEDLCQQLGLKGEQKTRLEDIGRRRGWRGGRGPERRGFGPGGAERERERERGREGFPGGRGEPGVERGERRGP